MNQDWVHRSLCVVNTFESTIPLSLDINGVVFESMALDSGKSWTIDLSSLPLPLNINILRFGHSFNVPSERKWLDIKFT